MDNLDILNVKCQDCTSPSWTRSTLLNDRAIQLTKAKSLRILRFSIVLWKIYIRGDAFEQWRGQLATFRVDNSFNELLGMDGGPKKFEWKNFQGFSALQILHRIQHDLKNLRIDPEQFRNRILFVSMFKDIDIYKSGNEGTRTPTRKDIRQHVSRSVKWYWAFIGRGSEEKWFEGQNYKPNAERDSVASKTVIESLNHA